MPTDVPDSLGNLPCDPSFAGSSSSAASAAGAQTSQAQDQHDSGEASILEDMEVAAAAEQASSRSRKRKTPDNARQEEDVWMVDLRSTMKANQSLLERLLEERSQPLSRRDAFIRFVSECLRSAPEGEFQLIQPQIMDLLVRRGHPGPSTSGPGPSTAPQASTFINLTSGAGPLPSTAAQASSTYTSQHTPPTYSQQHYVQLGFPSPSTWQYGGQHPQQSPSGHQTLTTPARGRDSAESVGKVLGSEDWNVSQNPPRLLDDF